MDAAAGVCFMETCMPSSLSACAVLRPLLNPLLKPVLKPLLIPALKP